MKPTVNVAFSCVTDKILPAVFLMLFERNTLSFSPLVRQFRSNKNICSCHSLSIVFKTCHGIIKNKSQMSMY